MSDARHDVVIVGGGLIGASLACALAPTGLDAALVEAVPFQSDAQPSYDEKMLSLAPASQRILDAVGVWPAIVSHGVTPIEHIHISDRGHWGKTRLSAAELGVAALGYVVPARVIGMSLVQRLTDTAAATLYCPATVSAIETDAEGVTVSVERDGAIERIRARLAVLADGGESRTREMLGIAAHTRDYGQTAILSTVTPDAPLAGTAFERFTDSGPLAMLPTTGKRCAVVWTAWNDDVDRIMAWSDEEFRDRLQARFGDWLGRLNAPARRLPAQAHKRAGPGARAGAGGRQCRAHHPSGRRAGLQPGPARRRGAGGSPGGPRPARPGHRTQRRAAHLPRLAAPGHPQHRALYRRADTRFRE